MTPYYENEHGKLYCGDCLEIMPQLIAEGVKVEAVVTDPPYGIRDKLLGGSYGACVRDGVLWDTKADQNWADAITQLNIPVIMWGGNFYKLPLSRGWLVWYKPDAPPSLGKAELAWTNIDTIIKLLPHTIAATNAERVEHPTQKPLRVMQWCIKQLPDGCQTILDPFAGSGTTLVAAQSLGRRWLGIEISEQYCEIAKKRLEGTIRQIEGQQRIFDLLGESSINGN